MASKYKKKPVVVKAMRYEGTDDSFYEAMRFAEGDLFWSKQLDCP